MMKQKMISTEKKVLYERRVLFAVLIIVFAMLQNTPHLLPSIFGAHALILIPLAVCLGMFEKAVVAAVFGMFAGIMKMLRKRG